MNDPLKFSAASWSTGLRGLTILSMFILLGVIGLGLFHQPPAGRTTYLVAMVGIPLVVAVLAPAFIIRGFIIEDNTLFVQRPGWKSTVDLQGLQSATVDPAAMQGGWRTFGNGGLFCFAGNFRSKKLGAYRAWVTDPVNSVVLKFADRTLVVSPDRPDDLARRLNERATG